MRLITFISLSFVFLFSSLVQAETPVSDIKVLNGFMENFSSMSARFKQVQPEEELFQEHLAKGFVLMKRPGKLVWAYEKPEAQKIIVDGKNLWVYDEDVDQVTVTALEDIRDDFPLRWLLYKTNLKKHFYVTPMDKKGEIDWFNLSPKKGRFFQSLDIAIQDGELKEIWMYQSSDNVIKVAFLNPEHSVLLDDREFEFELPRGVDLIGEPAL